MERLKIERDTKRLYELLKSKDILIPFVLLFFGFVFLKPFGEFIYTTVFPLFCYISGWHLVLPLILLSLFVFAYFIDKWRMHYIPSLLTINGFYVLFLLCVGLSFQLQVSHINIQQAGLHLTIFNILLVWLALVLAIAILILNSVDDRKNDPENDPGKALEELAEDTLERKEIASDLLNTVCRRRHIRAVAIIGSWGSGKTTFLNFIKRHIENPETFKKLSGNMQQPILINFNPWLVDGESDIIRDFFRTLRFELGKYSGAFSSSINKYVRLISKATKNQYLESIVDFCDTNEEPAGNAKMELNNLVKHINHDIYIFIDDIDRLTPNEILQVLKIIRSTGSFSNITYFVAFDKGYVSASLDGLKIHEPIFYLEKIFPSQRQLPAIGSKKIRKRMVEAFQESALPPAFLEEVTHLIEGKPSIEDDFIDVYIRTFRDVHILVNTFANHISNLKDDVNFRDFLFVTTLYVKNKKLFELLKDNKERIFGTDETRHRLTIPENLEELEKLCKDNGVNLDARIQQSLNFLFPRGGFLEHNKRENRLEQYANQEPLKFKDPFTISDTSYYTRYFELNLDTYDLSLEKYYEIQNKTFEENKIEITNLLNHGTLVGFFEGSPEKSVEVRHKASKDGRRINHGH